MPAELTWSGEPRVILWFIVASGLLCRHNFYHQAFSVMALHRQQHFEYERGLVAWLEYVERP